MKKLLLLLMTMVLAMALTLTGCGSDDKDPKVDEKDPVVEAPIEEEKAVKYDNGIYRGIYADRGVEQVGIQFELEDNIFTNVSFRQLYYDGEDYRGAEAGSDLYPVKQQFEQVANYLLGKPLEAVNDLHAPDTFVEDVDGFTGATLRSNKMFSAIKDGLNRGIYTPTNGLSADIGTYDNGRYRGIYADRGVEQVGIQFELENNVFTNVSFRQLYYDGEDYRGAEAGSELYSVKQQFEQVADYLLGKPLTAIFDLHAPAEFVEDVDGFTGATVRSNKMFSAIKDGLNRGIYTPTNGFSTDIGQYEDGIYRGIYADRGVEQVGIQFELENNIFTNVSFRQLYYDGEDYRGAEAGSELYPVKQQFEQVAEYLLGKPLEAVFDLHTPGEFVEDVDGFTGATARSNKMFSAIMDGLNRGLY